MSMIWNKQSIPLLSTFYDFAKGVEYFLGKIKNLKTFPVFEIPYPPLTNSWRILTQCLFVCFINFLSFSFAAVDFTFVISSCFSLDLFDSMTYFGQVCDINPNL